MIPVLSWAEVLVNDPRIWRRANLVSPGQQVWSFANDYETRTSRFGPGGTVQPLGQAYARTITWRQLLDSSPEGRADIESYMRERRVREDDIAATASHAIGESRLSLAVNWAYGLTRRWSIGFQVPLIHRQFQFKSQVQLTPALAQGAGQQILSASTSDLRQRVSALAERELVSSGYNAVPESRGSWEWGDISLLSQFSLIETPRWIWSLQQMVRVPTARNPDLADYFQTTSDEGQVDVGLTSLVNLRGRRWTFGARGGFVMQLPDTVRLRVSSERYQVDPGVRRDLGDWLWAAVDTQYQASRRLGFSMEYSYLIKAADAYRAGLASPVDHAALARNTDQEVHQTRVGIDYRMGEAVRRGGVEHKWVASAAYTQPWYGRNSSDAGRASLELTNYF